MPETRQAQEQTSHVVQALQKSIDRQVELTEARVKAEQERLNEWRQLREDIARLHADFQNGQADIFARLSELKTKVETLERIARDNQGWLSDMWQSLGNVAESGRRTRKAVDRARAEADERARE